MYTFEFVDRPGDGFRYRKGTDQCRILYRNREIATAIDAETAQKIVDALNKADAS